MEQRVTIAGKTYIVPAARVSELISWLENNGVSTSPRQIVREITGDNIDSRQLLTEDRS